MSWTVTNPTGASITCTNAAPINVSSLHGNIPTTSYSCSLPTATAGISYSAIANFPGDANYNSINSSALTFSVGLGTPTLSVSGVQSSTGSGQIITYTATVSGVTGSLAPTGAPTWTLTGPGGTSCATPIAAATTTGVATIYTCVVPANSPGTYTASITTVADSNYSSGVGSNTFSLSLIKSVPSVAVSTNSPTVALGGSFTFSATVSGPAGGATPTGAGSWSIIGVSGISCPAAANSASSRLAPC